MRKIYLLAVTLIVFFGNLCAQVNLDSGLVAYYPLNGNANDESGNGNHGTVMGGILTTDRFGNDSSAYSFDGINDIIDLGDAFNDVLVPFSISLWVFKDQIGPWLQGLISSDNPPNIGGNYYGFWLTMVGSDGNPTISVNYGDGGPAGPNGRRSMTTVTSVPLNEWVHLAIIVRGATDMSIYYNAFDVGGIYSGTGGDMVHNDWLANMGKITNSFTHVYFNGVMDDIRIYDRALTPEEVDSLFNEQPITSIDIASSNLPDQYELRQNYPNPFNPTTKILYSIPKSSFVKLKIYDISGREVQALVSQFQTAGSYSIDFNVGQLSSGIYTYRLQAGSFTATKKMMVVK